MVRYDQFSIVPLYQSMLVEHQYKATRIDLSISLVGKNPKLPLLVKDFAST